MHSNTHRLPLLAVVAAGILGVASCEDLPVYWGGYDPDAGDAGAADGGGGGGGGDAGRGPGDVGSGTGDCAVDCAANSVCRFGVCMCVDGAFPGVDGCEFPAGTDPDAGGGTGVELGDCVDGGPGCPDANDPRERTAAQVCARWQRDYHERATTIYRPGATSCDPGEIDPESHEDAMRRLNLYRWLVGLEPATVGRQHMAMTQAAAVMFHQERNISHFPPRSWACWTEDANRAAGSSNISWGYRSAAESLDGYIDDEGVPSLGHRRWALLPDLDEVAFGHHGVGGAMYVFSSTSRAAPEFVAYPPPGPSPVDAILGDWSFSTARSLRGATVTVEPAEGGAALTVNSELKESGAGWETIGFTVSPRPTAGDRLRITVSGAGNTHSYEVELVRCDG